MWLIAAIFSAFFAGLTSILAKCGIRKTDSDLATAIRTIVVLIFSWIMVFIVGSQGDLGDISGKSYLFLQDMLHPKVLYYHIHSVTDTHILHSANILRFLL